MLFYQALSEAQLIGNMTFTEAEIARNVIGGAIAGASFGVVAFLFAFILALIIGLYIYISLAFVAIGKKAKVHSPNIAWIPFVGPLLIASRGAKMHWWPILLILIPWIGWIATSIFFIVWMWKTFARIKRPGWWALLLVIGIVNLIILGLAAWGKK